ncbi:NAD(P)-binding protein [Nibribacter ruber]|uniref:NAD(P)-binding protein n=1 Tax=Nibribacter ruber TaxID=2698458 RepID=A0A6P1NWK1_9BACT|nr:FAD-dependent monooxygenase [Nibribacter ruber]QHL86609.1 NAD(P)-binding protein [Nibribacter ruber]
MTIGIIGGGIGGLTTAIGLHQVGIQVEVFEAAPAFAPVGAGLALAANAIKGLQRLGIAQGIIARGQCLDGFHIFDEKGRLINRTDSRAMSAKYGLDNFVIHRASLHEALLEHLTDVPLHVNKRVLKVENHAQGVTLFFQDGSTRQVDFLVVADGINSQVRQQLLPSSKPRYAGYTCWRAVIENPGLTAHYASETWGPDGRVGWTPLQDNKIYWFACINGPQNDPAMRAMNIEGLRAHFQYYHAPIPYLFAATKPEELLWHDLFDLAPISTFAFPNILLLGDAAHATTPNMGQGACQAIEDAAVLTDELQKDLDFNAAAQRFEKRRLDRTHWVTNQSKVLGSVAQMSNPFLIKARNFALRHLPTRINDWQLEKVYSVDF